MIKPPFFEEKLNQLRIFLLKVQFTTLQDKNGNYLEYSLTYINTKLFAKDNGRIIGYDNAHGEHHCHRMGVYKKVEFESFEKILELFENEWRAYHDKHK